MWSTIGTQLVSELGGSAGYTANMGLAIEALVIANQYALIPAFKHTDIAVNKLIWGEEAALKTEQDWIETQEKYLNPVFNFVSWSNATLQGKSIPNEPESTTHNLQYTKSGGVGDIDKIGPAGSQAKLISDAIEQFDESIPKENIESKQLLEGLE